MEAGTTNEHWESLTPEEHDDAALFWDQRAEEALAQIQPDDSDAIRENVEAGAEARRMQASEHRAAAKRKRENYTR